MRSEPASRSMAARNAPPLTIALLVFPDCVLLDLAGPMEVFQTACSLAEREGRPPPYRVVTVAARRESVRTRAGLAFTPDATLADTIDPVDTLLVVGGRGVHEATRDAALLDWLRAVAARARRVGSICTGAYLLAAAGLLDGRRAATHWRECANLAAAYPTITVDGDSIFVEDRGVYTSAGVSAGIDLALALVEEDCGHACALAVARQLVLFLKRPGCQSQLSVFLAAQAAERSPIRAVQDWALQNLAADLSIQALADRAAMSPRNFARVFHRETGQTPGHFVETARLEAARHALESSDAPLEIVAAECGFPSAETLRRVFQRRLGVAPRAYRQRFRRTVA